MADESKKLFPVMPNNHWWVLRRRFRQSTPSTVTVNYLATVLNIKEGSARANVLSALKIIGIVDADGKTLDRARRWRDDLEYPQVCQEIIREVYPQGLLDAVPDPSADMEGAKRWFANQTGAGEDAVRKYVTFYQLLTEANPIKGQEAAAKSPSISKDRKAKQPTSKKPSTVSVESTSESDLPVPMEPLKKATENSELRTPSIHIDIQIHIDSQASADQIDQVFASMAKHLYKRDE